MKENSSKSKTLSVNTFSLFKTRETELILEGAGKIKCSYWKGQARFTAHTGRGRRDSLLILEGVGEIHCSYWWKGQARFKLIFSRAGHLFVCSNYLSYLA